MASLASLALDREDVHALDDQHPIGLPSTAVVTGGTAWSDRQVAAPMAALPEKLRRVAVGPVRRDLFAVVAEAPPAPTLEPLPQSTPAVVETAPMLQPEPPPAMTWRFLGAMRDPEGRTFVYLGDEEQTHLVSEGSTLPNGYRIESIGRAAGARPDEPAISEVMLLHEERAHREVIRVAAPSMP